MENLENLQTKPENASDEAKITENVTPDIASDASQLTYDAKHVQDLIDAAEKRGYLKGRNEQIEAWLMTPDSNAPDPSFELDSDGDSCPEFLAHIRPGFWD